MTGASPGSAQRLIGREGARRWRSWTAHARTLIPGLVDCHVHYSSPGGPDWVARFTDPPATLTLRAVELAGVSLRGGITSAREVGAPMGLNIRLAHAAAAGHFPAPHLRAAGAWIAHAGTYVPFAHHFASADELRAAIHEEIAAGADLIKVALAPWNADAPRPDGAPAVPFDAALLAVAVAAAHDAGLTHRLPCQRPRELPDRRPRRGRFAGARHVPRKRRLGGHGGQWDRLGTHHLRLG